MLRIAIGNTDLSRVDDQELEDWLGGRDSNPDNLLQRQCPTVGRPPSTSVAPRVQELPIIASSGYEASSTARAHASPGALRYRVSSTSATLIDRSAVGGVAALVRRDFRRRLAAFLLPPMARHSALAAGLRASSLVHSCAVPF